MPSVRSFGGRGSTTGVSSLTVSGLTIQLGDRLVALASARINSTPPLTANWSSIATATGSQGTRSSWRDATQADVDSGSITVTTSAGADKSTLIVFVVAPTVGSTLDTPVGAANSNASSTTATFPAVTPPSTPSLLILMGTSDDSSAAMVAPAIAPNAGSAPITSGGGSGNNLGSYSSYGTYNSTSSTGTIAVSVGASDVSYAHTVYITETGQVVVVSPQGWGIPL